MCTVTFVPLAEDEFVLTSNRDEAPGRETFPPKTYEEDGVNLLYPKDAVAGGTWIGSSDRKRVVTLMNGGFVAHERKPYYGRSRGLIVKDLLMVPDLFVYVNSYDFSEIEPFTAVIVDWSKSLNLYEVVWDGERIHLSAEPLQPKIWSSSPLYPEDYQKLRQQWFSTFLKEHEHVSPDDVLLFHQTAGEGDPHSNVVMDRGFVKTKSITQVVKSEKKVEMHYNDLETGIISNSRLFIEYVF